MTPLAASHAYLQRPDGARLALYADGPHDPDLALILVHGWQAAAGIWDELVRQMPSASRVRIVRYDQRGHGRSTPGRATPSIPLLADDLTAVISVTAPGNVPVNWSADGFVPVLRAGVVAVHAGRS